MATKKSKKTQHIGASLALVAGAVATLAGGYFLYGPKGADHRKQIKGWTLKAKGEVLHEIEKMKTVSHEGYDKVVNKVMGKYGKLAGVTGAEIAKLGKELKSHWKSIEASVPNKHKASASPSKKKSVKK